MKRGDLVIVSLPGDYGKPRPALVIQADQFAEHASVMLLPITSHRVEAPLLRIDIGPGSGLDLPSQIQVDKLHTLRRERIGPVIGSATDTILVAVGRAIAVFLALASSPEPYP